MDQVQALVEWPEDGVIRTPYVVYSDPEVYQAEMKRIFRGPIWHYLGLEVEIPEAGDYRLMDVGDTPVIVLRDGSGNVSALVNRCAHKGTVLLFEPFGNVKELMCVYHNWLYDLDGKQLDLLNWLDSQGPLVDQRVLVGSAHRVGCRIIARRLPPEVASRRRQKLFDNYRKKGRTPAAERLAWCDWMILVTNVPEELMTADEACVLYRSRWQVELLFKRWKSQGLVDNLEGSTTERKMARRWARLLAVVVQHWLVIASVWGDPRRSLKKACDAVRKFAILIAVTVQCKSLLTETIKTIVKATRSTARQNKRKRPSTFELLNNPEKLDYSLT